ncbi:MAG: amine dehydrogenase [Nitriliruptorales bacterium]|nr:amine dehydrogenase [Nitriliruptorales bacterium]
MSDERWQPLDDDRAEAHRAWLDNTDGTVSGRLSRHLADRSSRRGMLARFAKIAVAAAGVSVLPALPVSRIATAQEEEEEDETFDYTGTDPTDCNYWRYCNMGGRMCTTCAGGGVVTCPPGTTLGVEYWVGCCEDPETGRTYLIANYDCCGKSGCGESCGEPFMQDTPPNYTPGGQDRNVLWCMSDETQSYTCTVTPIIGEDCTSRPSPKTRAEFGARR